MSAFKQGSLMEEPRPAEFSVLPDPEQKAPQQSRKWVLWALGIVGLLAAGAASWKLFSKPAGAAYSAVSVHRGNLAKTINATGKVQAVVTVQLGTQVSGTVSELYADFNDHVKAGQVIARLDPSQIQAQLQQAKASLTSANARVASARSTLASQSAGIAAAKANVDRTESALLEANRAYKTTSDLVEAGVTPARDLQTSEAARNQAAAQKTQAEAQYQQAVAQAQASQSQLDQAVAEATQAKAAVDVAAVNLDRTYIRAPIDGVVVARNVDIGQTVAASLQAPTLFLIAKDLTKMQVLADVDEADVGQLSPESKVSFTVDAFPAETFHGRISQIRLAPNVVQNVTTYTAVIDVANPKLQLRPGMTATVTAVVAEKQDVLLVPNSALRFRPDGATPAVRGPRGEGVTLWKVEGEELKPVRVRLGMSDGVSTEVIGKGLAEGDRIAAPLQQQGSSPKKAQASPFAGGARPRGGRF
jgi:HlyD family secretion protein